MARPTNQNRMIQQQLKDKEVCEPNPLQNKERKLKEVLGKLHDEFEAMTK